MKKLFVTIIASSMILSLTACGSGTPAQSQAPQSQAASQSTQETTISETETEEPSESAEETTFSYPEKPIEIIVPFAAGGNQDTASRIIGAAIEENTGATIVVTNKEGGGSVIGQTYAYQQEADGYTVLAYSSVYTTNVITQDVIYDMNSFIPVAMYANEAEYIVVPAESEINSVEDFINAGHEKSLVIATSGHTTADHIAAEMLIDKTGVSFEYVHGDGAASVAQVIGGNQVDGAICNYSTVSSLVDQGKAKVLGIFATERSAFCPEVPTLIESGINLTYGKWRGFAVKEGTSAEVVKYLENAIKEAVSRDDVIASFEANGSALEFLDSESFTAMVNAEYESLVPVLERLNVE